MELQALIDGLKAHKNGAASYESVDEAIRALEAMRDVDGEKVVKGLSCHVYGHPHTRCHNCPYWGTGPHGSSECSVLAADALALIRKQQERIAELEAAQTARLITMREASETESCYVEYKSGDIVPAFVRQAGEENYIVQRADMYHYAMPYHDGVGLRFWKPRPTDEQREAVKWE